MKKRSRTLIYPFVIIGFLSILTNSCTKDDEKDYQPPTIVGTESWKMIEDGEPASISYLTFTKKSDGSITTSGTWSFQGITCTFRKAVVTYGYPSLTFTAIGTATNIGLPDGHNTSPFKLDVSFSTGNHDFAFANWTSSFTVKNGWPTEVEGYSYGTRTSGSGVTD